MAPDKSAARKIGRADSQPVFRRDFGLRKGEQHHVAEESAFEIELGANGNRPCFGARLRQRGRLLRSKTGAAAACKADHSTIDQPLRGAGNTRIHSRLQYKLLLQRNCRLLQDAFPQGIFELILPMARDVDATQTMDGTPLFRGRLRGMVYARPRARRD
jgi:hypothetical protein